MAEISELATAASPFRLKASLGGSEVLEVGTQLPGWRVGLANHGVQPLLAFSWIHYMLLRWAGATEGSLTQMRCVMEFLRIAHTLPRGPAVPDL